MSAITSARGRIREAMIDTMSASEARELIAKIEEAIEVGYDIGEPLFEEYVGEVLSGRTEDDEAVES